MLFCFTSKTWLWMRSHTVGQKTGNLSCSKVRGTLRTQHKRDGLKLLSLCLASSYAKQELIRDMLRI